MTVAVHRLPKGESVVHPRSRCPACGAEIGARDNVPVLSWLLLRGRCRRCGERISVVSPILELATAALVVLAAIRYPNPWQAVLVSGLLALMPGIALIDLRHRIIPNRLMYPALLLFAPVVVLAWLIGDAADPARAGIGLLLYGGILFVVAVVSRGMGRSRDGQGAEERDPVRALPRGGRRGRGSLGRADRLLVHRPFPLIWLAADPLGIVVETGSDLRRRNFLADV